MPPTATCRARVREAAPPHMWLADGRSLFDALASRDARDLYEAPLALIRPDPVVAWRGFDHEDAAAVLGILLGGVPKGGA
jgi:hypothetical protein